MDTAATEAGAQPFPLAVSEYDLDGEFKFALVPDDYPWRPLKAERPDLLVFTMREAARALQAYTQNGLVDEIKRTFGGSEITEIRPPKRTLLEIELDDEVPYK